MIDKRDETSSFSLSFSFSFSLSLSQPSFTVNEAFIDNPHTVKLSKTDPNGDDIWNGLTLFGVCVSAMGREWGRGGSIIDKAHSRIRRRYL